MWDKTEVIESTDKNVKKITFEKEGDCMVEAVLYKYESYSNRVVICCSTQSGCPVGCRFCGAGDFFVRNLTTEEIVDQVKYCLKHAHSEEYFELPESFQIMFMSMGEPMLNWGNVQEALSRLGTMYPSAKLLISTIAPAVSMTSYMELITLATENDNIGLQFSVHESTDEKRNELIPFKAKLSLQEMSVLGTIFSLATKRNAYFNYCAGEDNTTYEDAKRLHALFGVDHFNATISVICDRDESVAEATKRQSDLAKRFQNKLDDLGYDTRVFNPAGQDDIGGGCGQLFHVQRWVKEHPERAKRTQGTGLPVVHTPH